MKKTLVFFVVILLLSGIGCANRFNTTIDVGDCREIKTATISGSILGKDTKMYECSKSKIPYILVEVQSGRPSVFLVNTQIRSLEDNLPWVSDFIEKMGDGTGWMARLP